MFTGLNTLHKIRQKTENASSEETQEEDNEDIASTLTSFYDDRVGQEERTSVTGSDLEKEEEEGVEMEVQLETTEQVEGSNRRKRLAEDSPGATAEKKYKQKENQNKSPKATRPPSGTNEGSPKITSV